MIAELTLLDSLTSIQSKMEIVSHLVYFTRFEGEDPHDSRGVLTSLLADVSNIAALCHDVMKSLCDG